MARAAGRTPVEAFRVILRIGFQLVDLEWHSRVDIRKSFPPPRPSATDLEKYLKLLVHARFLRRGRGATRGGKYIFRSWPTNEHLDSEGFIKNREGLNLNLRPAPPTEMRALNLMREQLELKAEAGVGAAIEGLAIASGPFPHEVGTILERQEMLAALFKRGIDALDDRPTRENLAEITSPLHPYIDRALKELAAEKPVQVVFSNLLSAIEENKVDLDAIWDELEQKLPEMATFLEKLSQALPYSAFFIDAESSFIDDSQDVTGE